MSNHYLTAGIPGTGGSIKETPDDFRVEEIPLYLPSGEGEHLYVTVEKEGMTTHQLLRRCAQIFSVKERDIGYAGLKDSNATTTQTISIPLLAPDKAKNLEAENIRVISARRHNNKLRPGHLAGNRFNIRVAAPDSDALHKVKQVQEILQEKGVPNYFGVQRYGVLGNSHLIGRAILQNEYEQACRLLVGDPEIIAHADWKKAAELYRAGDISSALEHLPRHCRYERQLLAALAKGKSDRKALFDLPRNILRLYLSAFQSSLFDRIVDMRLATIDKLWPGDIAVKHANGACFRVQDAAEEQSRADNFEISASGPLFGHKAMLASGQSGILEEALLDKEKLSLPDFKIGRGLDMIGERRALRVRLSDFSASIEGDDLMLTFILPKGSYATSLLREIIKH